MATSTVHLCLVTHCHQLISNFQFEIPVRSAFILLLGKFVSLLRFLNLSASDHLGLQVYGAHCQLPRIPWVRLSSLTYGDSSDAHLAIPQKPCPSSSLVYHCVDFQFENCSVLGFQPWNLFWNMLHWHVVRNWNGTLNATPFWVSTSSVKQTWLCFVLYSGKWELTELSSDNSNQLVQVIGHQNKQNTLA